MWILIVVTLNYYSLAGDLLARKDSSPSTVVTEISTRERCIKAANFAKTRKNTADAYCVQK